MKKARSINTKKKINGAVTGKGNGAKAKAKTGKSSDTSSNKNKKTKSQKKAVLSSSTKTLRGEVRTSTVPPEDSSFSLDELCRASNRGL